MINRKKITYLLAACMALLVLMLTSNGELHAQDVSVRAYVNQSSAVENQAVTLSVEVSGRDAGNASEPELPDFGEWFAFAGSRGRSQNIQIVNGQMSSSTTFSYAIIPTKAGAAKIPPVKVTVGGKTFQSEAITVQVSAAGAAPPQPQQRSVPGLQPPESETVDMFVLAVPDKKTVYQNEGITVAYKVFIGPGVSVQVYSPQNMPHSAGFWTEEYPQPQPVPRPEVYDGRQYQSALLKQVELFPTNSGSFSVDPLTIEFTIRVPRRRRSQDIFGRFFDNSMFSETRTVHVNSSKLDIKVKPLPVEGRPAEFNGAVGKYRISADVDRRVVKENDSVTLTVKISGTGNIKLLEEPPLNISGVFEKYDPQVSENIVREKSTVSGEKVFEYVIIPRQDGTLRIDPVVFAYFDPAAKEYRTLRTKPIEIKVEPGIVSASRTPRNLTREEVRLVGSDIRFIKETAGEWQKTGNGLLSWGFAVLLMLPLVLTGGAFMYSRHLDRLSVDIGYKRSRRATAVANRHLKAAKSALDGGKADAFYPEITKALHDYIADKLNISAAGILTDELKGLLQKKKIDEDLVNEYISCLEQCDFHRFASATGGGDMRKLYEDSRAAILNMEERLRKTR